MSTESPLGHHLFQVPIAERIAQIPTKAEDDNLVLKVSPAKQRRPFVLHSFTLPELVQPVWMIVFVAVSQISPNGMTYALRTAGDYEREYEFDLFLSFSSLNRDEARITLPPTTVRTTSIS